jgi:signal recognition particle subunit SRP54
MKRIVDTIPGLRELLDSNPEADIQHDMRRIDGIIHAMTPEERRDPSLLNRSRHRRIARGSGVDEDDVRKLVREFFAMRERVNEVRGRWKL